MTHTFPTRRSSDLGDNDCTHSGRPSASPKKVMTATTASAAHAPGAKRGATPNSAVDTPTSTSRAGTVTRAAPSMRGTSPASVVMTAYATLTPKPAAAKDRKSDGWGKRVSVRLDLGGRGTHKKKNN